jgi:hypothetical protein
MDFNRVHVPVKELSEDDRKLPDGHVVDSQLAHYLNIDFSVAFRMLEPEELPPFDTIRENVSDVSFVFSYKGYDFDLAYNYQNYRLSMTFIKNHKFPKKVPVKRPQGVITYLQLTLSGPLNDKDEKNIIFQELAKKISEFYNGTPGERKSLRIDIDLPEEIQITLEDIKNDLENFFIPNFEYIHDIDIQFEKVTLLKLSSADLPIHKLGHIDGNPPTHIF